MRRVQIGILVAILGILSGIWMGTDRVEALSAGPPLETTGAPGEATCNRCHHTYPINSGLGGVDLDGLPDRYVPGQTYQFRVRVFDPNMRAWGFQITSLTENDEAAGVFQSFLDQTWQALGPSIGLGRNYAQHTKVGTYPGQTGGAEWVLNWRAPSMDVGPVRFYVCGNATNNDHTDFYDYVYSKSVTIDGQTKIVSVDLEAPVAGARIAAGEPTLIRWVADEGDIASPASFRILLSTDGGENFPSVIAANLAADARTFVWNVPEALATETARIRVVVTDSDGAEHRDSSTANLSIGPVGLDRVDGQLATPSGVDVRVAAWADFDRDGRVDVAVGRKSGRLYLFRQTGAATFADATEGSGIDVTGDVRALAWGDLDGDDLPDLVVVAVGSVSLYRNAGGGVFENVGAPTMFPRLLDPRAVAWLDADGDGRLDLVIASSDGVTLMRAVGDGTFVNATAGSGIAQAPASAVVSGPLLAIGYDSGLRLYARVGSALVDVTSTVGAPTIGFAVRALAWADVTLDGTVDLIVAGGGGVRILEGRDGADVRFSDATDRLGLSGLGAAVAASVGDYDGDGDGDLFVGFGIGQYSVLRNGGTAGFTDVTARFALDAGARGAVWLDVDGDGSLDLATVSEQRVSLFENPRATPGAIRVRAVTDADGDASSADAEPDHDALGATVVVDLDGDGDWTTGAKAAFVIDSAGRDVVVPLAMAGPVLVRVEFADGEIRQKPSTGAEVDIFADPLAPRVDSIRYTNGAKGAKLIVDGEGLAQSGGAVEVEGRALSTVKAPVKFRRPDGTSSRLVGKDAALAALVATRPVRIRVVVPGGEVFSAGAVLR